MARAMRLSRRSRHLSRSCQSRRRCRRPARRPPRQRLSRRPPRLCERSDGSGRRTRRLMARTMRLSPPPSLRAGSRARRHCAGKYASPPSRRSLRTRRRSQTAKCHSSPIFSSGGGLSLSSPGGGLSLLALLVLAFASKAVGLEAQLVAPDDVAAATAALPPSLAPNVALSTTLGLLLGAAQRVPPLARALAASPCLAAAARSAAGQLLVAGVKLKPFGPGGGHWPSPTA